MTLSTCQALVVALLVAIHPAMAQQASPSEALFGRLMEARMNALARDSAIAIRAPGKRGMALMQAAGDSALYFASDSDLRELSNLFAWSAAHATPTACARLYTAGEDAFPNAFADILRDADSTLVDRWADFMTRLVRAGITRPPIGRLASADEIGITIRELIERQPASDRERIRLGASKTGDVKDVCLFTVTLYRELGSLPSERVGPVLRAMVRGVQPKLQSPPA